MKNANNNYTWNNQTYTQSGTYTQILKNQFGCDSTVTLNLTITPMNTNGIEELRVSKIKIFPNPANNNITIEYDGMIEKIEILDVKGATVYTTNEPKNEFYLPQNIQTGYYTVVIQTAEGIVRKELMIEK